MFVDLLFYISSICFQRQYAGKPEVASGVFGILLLLIAISFSILRRFCFPITNSPLFLTLLFLFYIVLYLLLFSYYKKNNKGLKIIIKFRKKMAKTSYVIFIWLLYFLIVIPAICYLIVFCI